MGEVMKDTYYFCEECGDERDSSTCIDCDGSCELRCSICGKELKDCKGHPEAA